MPNDMTIAQEEIFGPVLSVIAYDTEEEAIKIANDTRYGLHAFVSGTTCSGRVEWPRRYLLGAWRSTECWTILRRRGEDSSSRV
jgi:hypothetical protein